MIQSNQELRDRDRTVQIALASDQNYFCGLLVTAVSIAEHADANVTLAFTILDGGIREDSWQQLLSSILHYHPNSTVRRVAVNEQLFGGYPTWGSFSSRMIYARFLLPDILSLSDFVLYCDVDFLWRGDVSELWQKRSDRYAMIGAKDMERRKTGDVVEQQIGEWFAARNLPINPRDYICSGIILFNLALMRREESYQQLMTFIRDHPDSNYPDQDALNSVFYGRVGIVDGQWQFFSRDLSATNLNSALAIHYAGDTPWARFGLWCFGLTDVRLLWFEYYAKICNKSVWGALREFYSSCEILVRRLVYKLAVMPVVRSIYFALLTLTGRGAYVVELQRLRKLN